MNTLGLTVMGLALLLAGCRDDAGQSVAALQPREPQERRVTHSMWKQVFQSADELYRSADVIVLARSLEITPGRMALSDTGQHSLPFELVSFQVLRGLKGASAGERIQVERVGGIDASGNPVIFEADGGPFEQDRPFLLFLMRQPSTTTYHQVNHQGRYAVIHNRLYGMDPADPVIAALHDNAVDAAAASIQRSLTER